MLKNSQKIAKNTKKINFFKKFYYFFQYCNALKNRIS